jgi:hypothetical protein
MMEGGWVQEYSPGLMDYGLGVIGIKQREPIQILISNELGIRSYNL